MADFSTNNFAREKIGSQMNFATREAYNLLRTNLSFSFANNGRAKIIGVTSSAPNEGKSYNAINLAYSLAESNNKVLFIDCDMRKSTLSKRVNLPQSPGLSNYLVGEPQGIIHEHCLDVDLSIIMSGDFPPNPSELLGSAQMKSMLEMFSERYDYIIVDLPPVNAVADPLVMAKLVDGFVFVVKHKQTRRGELMNAIRQISFTKTKILGFVYNGYVYEKSSYSRYGKYRYSKYGSGYGYGYYKK